MKRNTGALGRVSQEGFRIRQQDLPGEVEMVMGEDFPVTPQIKGALKSLPGVVTVEEV